MIDISKLRVGDKVFYHPPHLGSNEWNNGIVKEVPEHPKTSVRVVYNCNGEWEDFMNYTGALTYASDLYIGWCNNQLNLMEKVLLEE